MTVYERRISAWSSDVCSSDLKNQGFAAPMSGTLLLQQVAPGTHVQKGDAIVTLEAMKMEHTLYASEAGTVVSFLAAAGAHVSAGRSGERRVGKECVSRCRYRGAP